ncbi:MAG TPA: hypothetical protein VMU54_15660 [Planctomycetota bacterium]|nr:hypothetical protein [Planctomycetota bacterium]
MMGTLGRLWAIAGMTLLEASRRKVFTILLLFGLALMSSVLFFPSVQVEARLRLIEVWALRASAIFTAIVGLFLAGFSLPQDFETKRIYLIVTKPISKPLVFLGRYLGYALLLAVFILSMGAVTSIFLRTVQVFSGKKFPALVAYPRLRAGDFDSPGGTKLEDQQGERAVGFGPGKALVWSFSGLRRSAFEDTARMQIRLIFGAEADPYRAAGTVEVRIANRSGGVHSTPLSMNTNEEQEFSFPAALIGDDGVVQVQVRTVDADGIIASSQAWLILYEKSVLFELAFARGLALILLQSMIVLSITLMSSTFLSAPLSILLGILLYLVGSVHGYVREGSREIDLSLAEIRLSKGKEKVRTPEGLPPLLLRFSTGTSKLVLAAVPDFATFDYSVWLLKDHAVSWGEIAGAARKASLPIAVMVALGTLLMVFKDFDR